MRCNQDHHGSILEEVGQVVEAGTTAAIQHNETVIFQPEEIDMVTQQQFVPTIIMKDIIAFSGPISIPLTSTISTSIEVQDAVAVQGQESGHSDPTSSQVAAIIHKGTLATIEHDRLDNVAFGQRAIDIPPVQEPRMVEDKADTLQAALEQGISCGTANVKVIYTASQESESAERLASGRSNVHETALHLPLPAAPTSKGQEGGTVDREPQGTSRTADERTSRATETITPMRPIAVSPEPRHRQRGR